MLSGIEVADAIDSGLWGAWRNGKPIKSDALHVGGVSIDATLGSLVKRVTIAPGWRYIDLHEPDSMQVHDVEQENGGFILEPGNHYLGHVAESFDCAAKHKHGWYLPNIDGRSTPARASHLCVHATAGRGEFAWGNAFAQFTLELSTILPVLVRPGDRMAQIQFDKIDGDKEPKRYCGAYPQQVGPRAAVLGRERF